MVSTLTLIITSGFLFTLLLCGYLVFVYKKLGLLKKLVQVLDEYQAQPHTLQEIRFQAKGQVGVLINALNRLVQSLRKEHDSITTTYDQIRATNRVITYNKKKFEGILDAIPDGVLVMDLPGNITLANRAAAIHVGVDKEEILGNPPHKWMGHTDWDRLSSSSGDRYVDIKREGPHMAKTLRVSIQSIGLADSHSGQVIIVKDITEQVLAEQARGEFVAHVAHELKSPLNTLKAYTEMLMDGEAGDEGMKREFYNTINAEADRLAGLIGNLLNITKIEMGSLQIRKERVKTREFLEGIYHIAEEQKRGKKILMTLLLPDKLPAIKADKDLLSVALLNLLSNAIKYTDEGKTVSLKAEEDEEVLMIHVIDSGIGISALDLPHIFEKFYRSEDKRARERPGHGLGLALTQQIIHLHDGDIQVISHPGEGSQFTVILKKAEDILK